ncbi:mechanosensitive ion channel domain-containing protein [Vibrio olivae]
MPFMEVLTHYLSESLIHKLIWLIALLIGYRLVKRGGHATIRSLASKKQVKSLRLNFILRCFNVMLAAIVLSLLLIISGVGYGDIALFLSSIFAVLGVALVAQWSILSNITASFLIFFVFPYRIGDRIKVMDKDEDVRGEIIDITMFHVLIKHESGNMITYPNNLILQKGVIKLYPEHKPRAKSKLAFIHVTLASNRRPWKRGYPF